MSVQKIPQGYNSLSPHLVVKGANAAIEFYKKAFGAVEECRIETPDGGFIHGALRIGNSMLMLCEENKQWGHLSPITLGDSPVTIHLYVDDVDAAFKQAVEAGATEVLAPTDMFWGDRYGKLTDPFGHAWSLAMQVKEPTPEDIQKGVEMCAKMSESAPC